MHRWRFGILVLWVTSLLPGFSGSIQGLGVRVEFMLVCVYLVELRVDLEGAGFAEVWVKFL